MPPTSQPGSPNRGTGFTNLQQYLQANQGNQLPGAISSGIGRDVEGFQKGLSGSEAAFNQEAEAGRQDNSANQQNYENLLNKAQNINKPEDFTAKDYSTLGGYMTGGYTGPTGLSNIDQLQKQAQTLQPLGQAARTESGRTGLLQKYVGGPSYTTGQSGLDTLLLGRSGGNALANVQATTRGLGQQINNAQQQAQSQAGQYQRLGEQFGNQVRQGITGAESNLKGTLSGELSDAQNALPDQLNTMQNNLRGYTSLPGLGWTNAPQYQQQYNPQYYNLAQQAQALVNNKYRHGGTIPSWDSFAAYQGLKPQDYITQTAPTIQNIASSQEQARANALRQLLGESQLQFQDPYKSQQATQFNQAGFLAALKNLGVPVSGVIPPNAGFGGGAAGSLIPRTPTPTTIHGTGNAPLGQGVVNLDTTNQKEIDDFFKNAK